MFTHLSSWGARPVVIRISQIDFHCQAEQMNVHRKMLFTVCDEERKEGYISYQYNR